MTLPAVDAQFTQVLLGWAVIIGAARLLGSLAVRVGQPRVIGELASGIALGPSCLGAAAPGLAAAIFPDAAWQPLQILARIGLIFLLLGVGLEMDVRHAIRRRATVMAVSIAGIAAPMLLGWLSAGWLHATFAPATEPNGFRLFTCVALSITALPVMGRMLVDMQLTKEPFAVMSLSAAAIDDVVGWMLLGITTSMITMQFAWAPVAFQLVGLLVLLALMKFVVSPLLRAAWQRSVGQAEGAMSDSFLALLLLVLCATCLTAAALGLFAVFGAFLVGLSLHGQPGIATAWRRGLGGFVDVALVPVFFASAGLKVHIGLLDQRIEWVGLLVVVLIASIGKLGGGMLGALVTGRGLREAAAIGALMNIRGIMGLVVINLGAEMGLIPPELYTMLVIMALLTTAAAPILLRALRPR